MSEGRANHALRSDPDEVLRLALHVGDADSDGQRFIATLEAQLAEYDRVNDGPDVEVIVTSGHALAEGLRSSMAGLAEIAAALQTAEAELAALQTESDQLRREMEALGPADDVPDVRIELLDRFADIRAREDAVFEQLAASIAAASTGHDVTLDMTAVGDVIGRDASSIGELDVLFDVERALGLAADYAADGDFDTPATVGWDDDAVMLDLPDPGPTGDWDGWWLWRDFKPDDYESTSMAGVDATPGSPEAGDRNAITPFNAEQGSVGDCYFVAAVSSLANTPGGQDHLRDMIASNGDGTYTIAFGDGVEVTVDSDVYVNDGGEPAYGSSASGDFNWFSVLEKGFAARSDNSYEEIAGGWASPSWEILLGDGEATRIRTPSVDELTDSITADLDAEQPTALAFDLNDINETSDSTRLHEFSVLAVDEAAGEVTIRNPWGHNRGLVDGFENDYGATMGDDGTITIPIDNLAPIVHTYESYDLEAS
jgi:hypothetical protein